ncbi:sedoheptulose 7-phosphate cyclase [Streptomyces erythrochromogenes]|uniref:sedoheptulose 7-phosphate cyclase n=1 Tax=Streptomyces erythrochromogenes TaxID=285574 RepID=UPI003443B297
MTATKEVAYEIVMTSDIFDPDNPELGKMPGGGVSGGTRLVALDEDIERLFGGRIRRYFTINGIAVEYMVLAGGDEHKTIDAVLEVSSRLNRIGTHRVSTPPIGIGGGVLQDVVGMAASLYRRGIPYVRVPTTLLGQIDGAVGAKTGVNFEGARNRLGTFAPPPRTLIDRSLIATLPERQLRSGLGEVLKMALIKDARLFELLEQHGPHLVADRLQDSGALPGSPQPGLEVIRRAISGMAEELQKNLWETDLQRIVDFGHTFSPLVEMRALPELQHGEAVAMGCVYSAVLAANRGLLDTGQRDRIIDVTRRLGLACSHPGFADADLMKQALADTVQHRNGHQHLTLPTAVGETVFVDDITGTELEIASSYMADLLAWTTNADPATEAASAPPAGGLR